MKIKISKSQWENIGKVAGWLNKSSSNIRFFTMTPDYEVANIDEINVENLVRDGYNEAWLITYRYENFEGNTCLQMLSSMLISAENLFTNEKIYGGENIIKRLDIKIYECGEISKLIRANNQEWNEKQSNERTEMERGEIDDQQISFSDKYGPDLERPQY